MNIKPGAWPLVFLLVTASCDGQPMSNEQCKDAIADIGGAPEQLRKMESSCRGSGYFELASANAALSSGDLVAARDWVDSGLKVAKFDLLPFYEVEFSINEASNSSQLNKQIADAFVQSHPDAAAGYFLLGKYYAISGNTAEAIVNLEKARKLKGEVAIYAANKLLIPAYWNTDRVADAATAFDDADRAYPGRIYSDWSLTQLAAASHFLSGNPARAKSILEKQLALHPECATDKYVRKLAEDLGKKGFVVAGI